MTLRLVMADVAKLCVVFTFFVEMESRYLCVAASHEVNVICMAQVPKWPSSDGNGGVEIVEGILHDVLGIDVEQNWREEAFLENSNRDAEEVSVGVFF